MTRHAEEIPIVCTLDEEGLAAREENDGPLLDRRLETIELEDGYELVFPGDAGTARAVTEFVINERVCCRFFTIDVRYEPGDGPIRMRLRGPEGAKELLSGTLAPSA